VGEHPRTAQLKVTRVKGKPLVRELGLAALDAVILPNAIRELATTLIAALASKERRRT